MKSVQKKYLFTYLGLASFPFMIIAIILFVFSMKTFRAQVNNNLLLNLEYSSRLLKSNYERIEWNFDIIITNRQLQQILVENGLDPEESFVLNNIEELDSIFIPFILQSPYMTSCTIISYSGGSYSTSNKGVYDLSKIMQTDWFKKIEDGRGSSIWAGFVEDEELTYEKRSVYLIGSVIRDTVFYRYTSTINDLGLFLLILNKNFFSDIFPSFANEKTTINMVIDSSGNVFHSSHPLSTGDLGYLLNTLKSSGSESGYLNIDFQNKKSVMFYQDTGINDWHVLKIIPKSQSAVNISYISVLIILSFFFCIYILYLISRYISKKYSHPIISIAQAMKDLVGSNFNIKLRDDSEDDEIRVISQGFNTMVEEIRNLFQKTILEEREKRKAQIKALKYQINPHFIYNTLSGIRMMALEKENHEIADTIQSFSRLLRNTISSKESMITIKSETENAANYIKLAQMQYKNKLAFTMEVDKSISECMVPGMILQPILENSIAHGLIKKLGMPESDARIILKAYLLGPETVCFSIWDNGTGIDEKRIDDIMLSKYVSGSDSEHIGIRNIQDRIHYEFGENFNISIESVLGEFTEVKIYLPKISKEEIS